MVNKLTTGRVSEYSSYSKLGKIVYLFSLTVEAIDVCHRTDHYRREDGAVSASTVAWKLQRILTGMRALPGPSNTLLAACLWGRTRYLHYQNMNF